MHDLYSSLFQKIDNLKRQLTEMADLFKSSLSGEGLNEEEYEVLEKSGLFSGKKRKAGHLLFADSIEEGKSPFGPLSLVWLSKLGITSKPKL